LTKPDKRTLLLLILYIIFIIYSTTLPFDFTNKHEVISTNLRSIRWIPFVRDHGVRESIPDIVSNFLLFLPLGILMASVFLQARAKRALWSILLFTLLGSGLLSALVETTQILSLSRVTSLTDLLTNAMGGLCGASLSCIFYSTIREPLLRWSYRNAVRSPEVLLLAIYLGLLSLSYLVPFDISLDVGSIKHGLKSVDLDPRSALILWPKMLGPFLWLAGLCFLICSVLSRRFRSRGLLSILAALLSSFSFATALELTQVFIVSRVATAGDILAGFAGALYGCLLFVLLNASLLIAHRTVGGTQKQSLHEKVIFWLVLAHYLFFVGHGALFPYKFESPALASAAIRKALLPFASYYGKTTTLALFDFLGGIARFAPLGFLLQKKSGSATKRRAWQSIFVCFTLGFLLESLQLGIAGRFPDSSDVIAAGCGGYVGFLAWRWWRERETGGTAMKKSPDGNFTS